MLNGYGILPTSLRSGRTDSCGKGFKKRKAEGEIEWFVVLELFT